MTEQLLQTVKKQLNINAPVFKPAIFPFGELDQDAELAKLSTRKKNKKKKAKKSIEKIPEETGEQEEKKESEKEDEQSKVW